jgi:dephospho-CoA kinase
MRRDGSDESTIRGIIEAQISRKARLGAADDIIDNELPIQTLPDRVLVLHQRYCELAKSK